LLVLPKRPESFNGTLIIGQAQTPGQPTLPSTVQELQNVASQIGHLHLTQLNDEKATCAALLEEIDRHSWVHFACHASQNIDDPTSSAFYLHDGQLDLAAITKKPLEHADFAFLSACQNALGDENLPDEAVHLAAGMLLAGYRTVIATMWSIQDRHAPLIADKVYSHLMETKVPDSSKAAEALHLAVQQLREQVGERDFVSWVPYIHMGL
jgi:CHAT domain-containing protein